ncbi:MAG TPA: hypothetical protein VFE84_12165, partial [Patescibacteria group bacterium]|nr:hypothetical protein [Patescibacteria group bacterium]
MMDAGTVELLGLAALGVAYFLIAVLRSSYAELNPVAATRVLSSRGFTPREGEAPSDMPPVMRTTFDLLHHLVVIAASALWLGYLVSAGSARPFLYGAAALGAAMVVLQGLARALSLADPEMAFSTSLAIIGIFYHLSRPIIAPVVWTIRRMRRAEEERRLADGDTEATEEQIEAFIDAGQKEGIIEAEESELIRQVVEFHDSVVREVMTPRTEVVALSKDSTVAQAREVFA